VKTVRVGNGQGFWGDSVDAPIELLRGGEIDYVGMDYLAEVTLSIMMRQKLKNPDLGYATDFIGFIRRVLPELVERNVRVLSNAGGLNPHACRAKIFAIARELGLSGVRVGVVEGDDVFPRLEELVGAGHQLANMDTGEPIAPYVERMTSANAYLGARPVIEALAQADAHEQRARANADGRRRAVAADQRRHEHVVECGELRQQQVILEDEPDGRRAERRLRRLIEPIRIPTLDLDGARRRPLERPEHVEQGALAAARRSHHGHRLPAIEGERDAVEDRQRSPRRVVVLRDVIQRQHL